MRFFDFLVKVTYFDRINVYFCYLSE